MKITGFTYFLMFVLYWNIFFILLKIDNNFNKIEQYFSENFEIKN